MLIWTGTGMYHSKSQTNIASRMVLTTDSAALGVRQWCRLEEQRWKRRTNGRGCFSLGESVGIDE